MFFSGFAHATDEELLIRGVAADFIEIFTYEKIEDQTRELRAFVAKHRETLKKLSSAKSPGQEILSSRVFDSAAHWTPQMDQAFIKAVDATVKNAKFQAMLPFSTDLFQVVPDDALKSNLIKSANFFNKIKVSDQPGFKKILDPKSGVKIPNAEVKELVEKVLPKFYDNLSLRMKARIAAAVFRLPPGASQFAQANEVLQNSGPAAQKLFQKIGGDVESEEMLALMAALKDDIRPFPLEEAKMIFERNTGKKVEEVFSDFPKPFKAASIGQMHFATLKDTGEQIAVKIRRPSAVPDFLDEMKAMRLATEGLPTAHVVNSIEANLKKELDLRGEAEGIKSGRAYISDRKGISSVDLAKGFDSYEDMIFMNKVEGKNLDKFVRASDLLARGEAVSNVLDSWMSRAVFRDGFFHGDPHAGNFLFRVDKKLRKGYEIAFIDFGNHGTLTVQQQRGFMQMITSITLRSPKDLMGVIETLGTIPNEAARAKVFADIVTILEKAPTYPIDAWYSDVFIHLGKSILENKVDMPDSFMGFGRGKDFLESELRYVNGRLDELDPKGKLKRFNGTKIMAKTLLKELPRVPANEVRGLLGKEQTSLTIGTMVKLAQIWKNSYFPSIRVMCSQLYSALKGTPAQPP
ncbi:MAG: AarF/ABC1/UbiB kinase family protein, partial [Bdellovibrionota bacterium]